MTPAAPQSREAMLAAVEALNGALAWDEARDYLTPYKVRDPIVAALSLLRAALEAREEPVVWQSLSHDGLTWINCSEANARAAERYGFKSRALYASPVAAPVEAREEALRLAGAAGLDPDPEVVALGVPEAPAPQPQKICKLTECQGKPRCKTCLAMDAAYGVKGGEQ